MARMTTMKLIAKRRDSIYEAIICDLTAAGAFGDPTAEGLAWAQALLKKKDLLIDPKVPKIPPPPTPPSP